MPLRAVLKFRKITLLPLAANFSKVGSVDKAGQKVTGSPRPAGPESAAPAVNEEAPFSERHPRLALLILVALWLYVAALGLLALDQTFNWGIFGPKVPPT